MRRKRLTPDLRPGGSPLFLSGVPLEFTGLSWGGLKANQRSPLEKEVLVCRFWVVAFFSFFFDLGWLSFKVSIYRSACYVSLVEVWIGLRGKKTTKHIRQEVLQTLVK